jgi:large conductance mechanosensitive channel
MTLSSLPDPASKGRIPILGEFREFIARGNVIDLAVGVILGAAFSEIVKTLVDQVVMPPIGLLTSGADFANLAFVLKPAMNGHAEVAVHYGVFINALIKFLIVAWVVFLMVKLVNVIRRRDAAQPDKVKAAPGPQELLLTEIRDLLKAQAESQK